MKNKNISEDFKVQETLNPKLWGEDNKLLPEVKEKLDNIVENFVEESAFNFPIVDVLIVGSSASYNYNEKSDLDLHIITNFEDIGVSEEYASTLFGLYQASYNKKHYIFIRGIEVSLYVQDVQSGIASNGIYSVLNDEWIKFPQRLDNITQFHDQALVDKWKNVIVDILLSGNLEQVNNTINALYTIRRNSIAIDGEYGRGNLLFKSLRNLDLTKALKDKKNELESKNLSLESINN